MQSNHRHRLGRVLGVVVGAGLFVAGASCAVDGETDAEGPQALRSVELGEPGEHCVHLMAGQHIHVGWVCAEVDHDVDTSSECGAGSSGAVIVTYETHGGWYLTEEHLAVGDELDDIPTNNAGHPKNGHFPYHDEDPAGHTSRSFVVPLCAFGLDGGDEHCDPVTGYFAAHAVVKKDHEGGCQEETAWGEGEEFPANGGWAMYFEHELHCEHQEPC